ncbi:hypothetical protein C0995_008609 [Termitomyces sp. Mi166|nr:hypothetical protein C0995_008609 [Termitomyces sp. Mi166\
MAIISLLTPIVKLLQLANRLVPGLSEAQFDSFNPGIDCSALQPGQKVCISAGTLPSNAPKPQPNGTCAEYTTVPGDSCSAIAVKFDITVAEIEQFNANTFKWTGMNFVSPLQKHRSSPLFNDRMQLIASRLHDVCVNWDSAANPVCTFIKRSKISLRNIFCPGSSPDYNAAPKVQTMLLAL